MTALLAAAFAAAAGLVLLLSAARPRRPARRLTAVGPGRGTRGRGTGGPRRLISAGQRSRQAAEAAALPLACDLLAVALRGGAPVDQAVAAVAEALSGPLAPRLLRVARLLQLGSTPNEAWAELAPVPGAQRLVRAAVRSAEHGGALADALGRLAADLRADRAVAAEAAARRAGVLVALPLGLCFLPAFMLAGLVPVIVAVLGDAW